MLYPVAPLPHGSCHSSLATLLLPASDTSSLPVILTCSHTIILTRPYYHPQGANWFKELFAPYSAADYKEMFSTAAAAPTLGAMLSARTPSVASGSFSITSGPLHADSPPPTRPISGASGGSFIMASAASFLERLKG